jgi:pyridoxamine 5'-phosphate oxidase
MVGLRKGYCDRRRATYDKEMYQLMNENPVFHLVTMDGDQPRVRGMLLFKADEDGIIFHTASSKDVFAQIMKNPKAELCFQGQGGQIRVAEVLELVKDENLTNEVFNILQESFCKGGRKMVLTYHFKSFV